MRESELEPTSGRGAVEAARPQGRGPGRDGPGPECPLHQPDLRRFGAGTAGCHPFDHRRTARPQLLARWLTVKAYPCPPGPAPRGAGPGYTARGSRASS